MRARCIYACVYIYVCVCILTSVFFTYQFVYYHTIAFYVTHIAPSNQGAHTRTYKYIHKHTHAYSVCVFMLASLPVLFSQVYCFCIYMYSSFKTKPLNRCICFFFHILFDSVDNYKPQQPSASQVDPLPSTCTTRPAHPASAPLPQLSTSFESDSPERQPKRKMKAMQKTASKRGRGGSARPRVRKE